MCEEESDDHEAVAKLFEINDSIHRTLERYRLIKKGDVEGASKIPKGTLGASGAGVRQGAGGELSLIDFGEPEDQSDMLSSRSAEGQTATSNGNSLENDLLGLSMQEGPSISLGGPSLSSAAQQSSQQGTRKSNADILSGFNASYSSQPTASSRPTSAQPPKSPQPPSDPFGALTSARQGSPAPAQSVAAAAPSSSLLDLGGFGALPSNSASRPQTSSVAPQAATDDDWTFSSALPDSSTEMTVVNSSINVTFLINKTPQADSSILMNSAISNNTPQAISDLTFQLAVMKGYTLGLQPQSGRNLQPNQKGGITQQIRLHGHMLGTGKPVKVRWKASYWLGGSQREESGEIPNLGLT